MKQEDAFIQSQVEDVLKNARLLRNVDIRIRTMNGEVTLHGLVDVLAEKWLAEELVRQVPGIAAVDNSLTVAVDNYMDDNEITGLIREKLYDDPRADLHQVSVMVKQGVAYLEGNAGTLAEEAAAKEIAARVQGVKDVVSYINVGGGNFEIDDATVTNAVETALSRSTAVSARDVESRTMKGIVTLTGTVDTPEQIEAAVRVASQVPGVLSIQNNLVSTKNLRRKK